MWRIFAAIVLVVSMTNPVMANDDKNAINALLDDFHDAASKADGERYFGHFADGAVFLGTDARERWTLTEFKAFAEPYFSKGKGWTYKTTERHVDFAPDGKSAWFDELLNNEKLGQCRGSGVLLKTSSGWKLAQYNLTIPIPNDLALEVADQIKAYENKASE